MLYKWAWRNIIKSWIVKSGIGGGGAYLQYIVKLLYLNILEGDIIGDFATLGKVDGGPN